MIDYNFISNFNSRLINFISMFKQNLPQDSIMASLANDKHTVQFDLPLDGDQPALSFPAFDSKDFSKSADPLF